MTPSTGADALLELGQYLGLAFLGGIILNVMPCVLPVLTLKAFHAVHSLRGAPGAARAHGLAYAAGTTVAFLSFALIVIALRASGTRLGWGMHFQHPPFVAILVAVVFAFGLNALGVFEISLGMSTTGPRSGLLASFSNGLFAAVMSTPCTAPFLGTAAAFALAAGTPAWQTMALFGAIGLGLAAPFVALSFSPALIRLLPKPGEWMATFKAVMGFGLLATATWLFGAYQSQVTPATANRLLLLLVLLAAGLWSLQRFEPSSWTSPRIGAPRARSTSGQSWRRTPCGLRSLRRRPWPSRRTGRNRTRTSRSGSRSSGETPSPPTPSTRGVSWTCCPSSSPPPRGRAPRQECTGLTNRQTPRRRGPWARSLRPMGCVMSARRDSRSLPGRGRRS